jgi:hypothetical protein
VHLEAEGGQGLVEAKAFLVFTQIAKVEAFDDFVATMQLSHR